MSTDDPVVPTPPSSELPVPKPDPISPTPDLDKLRETVNDDVGTFTRIDIPVEFPGTGSPDSTKLD